MIRQQTEKLRDVISENDTRRAELSERIGGLRAQREAIQRYETRLQNTERGLDNLGRERTDR